MYYTVRSLTSVKREIVFSQFSYFYPSFMQENASKKLTIAATRANRV